MKVLTVSHVSLTSCLLRKEHRAKNRVPKLQRSSIQVDFCHRRRAPVAFASTPTTTMHLEVACGGEEGGGRSRSVGTYTGICMTSKFFNHRHDRKE